MRATIIAALLAGSVSAAPVIDYEQEAIGIVGDDGAVFMTWVERDNDCVPTFSIYEKTVDRWIDEVYTIKGRVDSKSPWRLETYAEGDENGLLMSWYFEKQQLGVGFINELRRGITFRIRVTDNWAEGFSLMGYSVAYSKLMAACKRNNHEMYL